MEVVMATGLAPFGLLSATYVAVRAVMRTADKTVRALGNRGAVHRLAHLDDRGLKDIGLTRGDVDGALAQPLHVDPSKILVDRRRMVVPRPDAVRRLQRA
jgi:uncharacterized protein YjiS (DUF1127 family)